MLSKKIVILSDICPHTYTYSFLVSPCTYYLNHYFNAPTTTPLSCFFGYLFVYLDLVSIDYTHRNTTFCLPPSVIIHFYVTHVFKNVFYFTSLAPRSVFIYLTFVLVPHDIFLLTWHLMLQLFYYPIIWRSYFLCTSPLSTWYHLISVSHLLGLPVGALKGNLVVMIS